MKGQGADENLFPRGTYAFKNKLACGGGSKFNFLNFWWPFGLLQPFWWPLKLVRFFGSLLKLVIFEKVLKKIDFSIFSIDILHTIYI